MIGSFLNGKFGLAKTYWFGVAGFGVIFQLFNRYITQQYLTTAEPADIVQLDLIHKGGMVVATVITLLLLRAVFKAATDNRTPGGWGWIAIVIAGLGVANVGYITATLLSPSIPTPRFMLQREIDALNQQLPQRMDQITTLQRATLEDDNLIYYIQIDDMIPEENKPILMKELSSNGVEGAALCVDFEGYFRGGLSAIKYEFTYTNDIVTTLLTAEECFLYLKDR